MIIGKLHSNPKEHNQEIRKLSAFNPFQDRRTGIDVYRGAKCEQKGCPMDHWIIGNLYAKLKVLTQKMGKL